MTRQQFQDSLIENVAQVIHYIANHEYEKLHTVTNINTSLYGDDVTLEMIGEWLDEQLKMWSECEEREFVIDAFEEKHLKISDIKDNKASASFFPHSHHKEIGCIFEFDFTIDENNNLLSEFSVNV